MSDTFVPYTYLGINDTVWTKRPLTSSFVDSVSAAINNNFSFVDSFDVNADNTIKFNPDLSIFFPEHAYAYRNSSYPVTDGKINVQILALVKKGDYIKYLIPTSAKNYLLQTAGSFFVHLTKNNQEVAMLPNTSFKIKWTNNNAFSGLNFFEGVPLANIDSLFTWAQTPNGTISYWDSTSLGTQKKGYQISTSITNWIGCSNLLDTANTVRLNVTLPLNYTNKNSFVFAVYNDKNSVVRLTADYATRSFYSLHVPVNSSITLVSISMIDNKFYAGTRSVTVANANRIMLSPVKSSPAEIISLLDNL
ncbi:MAG TPA: hypothetical protein VHP12_06140 [Chitinophagaceae bacterium]|nr:hypothetical protein [Chitinophagaceae bacterium]